MKPTISSLGAILYLPSQYVIPVFQRYYRLEEPQWENLTELRQPGRTGAHVMGFLVFVPGLPARAAFDQNLTNCKHPQNDIPALLRFDILTRRTQELSPAERDEVKEVAKALLVQIKGVLVPSWRQKAAARSSVMLAIEDVLNQVLPRAHDNPLLERKRGALFEHFYEVYPDLGRGVFTEAC